MRPNERFENILSDVKSKIGWEKAPRPLLSIHVRLGDACVDADKISKHGRICEPLAAYMERAVLPMSTKYFPLAVTLV